MTEKILIAIKLASHFVELSRVARQLKSSGKYAPFFYFQRSYPTLSQDVDVCKSENWGVLQLPLTKPLSQRSETIRGTVDALPLELKSLIRFVYSYYYARRSIKTFVSRIHDIIKEYQPSLMIFAVESVADANYMIIRIGRQYRIPSVIVPFTFADAKGAAEHLYNYADYNADVTVVNKLVSKLFPQYVYEYRGRRLLRLRPADIAARETSGFHYSRPWVNNSEESTILAVESEHMLEYYRNQGLPEGRLVVTGALYDDVLAKAFTADRKNFYRDFDLSPDNNLLLCALPPDQFPKDCEFPNYAALLQFWMQTLASLRRWNVLVRPHPRFTKADVDKLHRFGVRITQKDTATLVPLCDLYVTSVSATIRWAIACGKPVVNYDVYQFGYRDYLGVGGVLTLDNKNDFVDTLNHLTRNHEYFNRISAAQQGVSSRWGQLDGKSSRRMLELFEDIISRSKGKNE